MSFSMGKKDVPTVEVRSIAASESAGTQTDSTQRFTATGRPMPKYDPSALANSVEGFTGEAPQMLPWKFTDEDYMNVPIPIEDDDAAEKGPVDVGSSRKGSFMGRLGQKMTGKGEKKEKFRMVRMTRGEYLAKWARDEEGNYIGTDPVPGKLTR